MPVETVLITSEDQWKALRKRDVTASTAAALLGAHPYTSPLGIALEKTGKTEDQIDSGVLRRGRLLEPVAIQVLTEDRPDLRVAKCLHYFRDPEIRLGATPDVIAYDAEGRLGNIQVKTVAPRAFKHTWQGDDGVEVPAWIAVQAIIEAHLMGAEWAAVAALVVDFDITLHFLPIPLHAGVIEKVRQATKEFWSLVDSGGLPDPDFARDAKLLATIYADKVEADPIDLSGDNRIGELIDALADAKAQIKRFEALRDEAANEIKAKMQGHAIALVPGYSLTWKEQSRAEHVVKASTFRVLRASKRDF